jgi:hypothetical protein
MLLAACARLLLLLLPHLERVRCWEVDKLAHQHTRVALRVLQGKAGSISHHPSVYLRQ